MTTGEESKENKDNPPSNSSSESTKNTDTNSDAPQTSSTSEKSTDPWTTRSSASGSASQKNSNANSDSNSSSTSENPQGPPPLDEFFKSLFNKKRAPKSGGKTTQTSQADTSKKSSGLFNKVKNWRTFLGQNDAADSNKKTNQNQNSNSKDNIWQRASQNKNKNSDTSFGVSLPLVFLIIFFFAIAWVAAGFYLVKPAEQGVVLYFGKYSATVGDGPHWIPRGIASVQIVNTDQVAVIQQTGLMLTSEENLVQVGFVVKYRISDPEAYLFNVQDPIGSLNQITDSAVRQVVGHSDLTDILTDGRADIRDQVESQIKALVKKYNLGLTILDVDMQYAGAPDAVKDAFDDVIKAREDQVTYINNGNTYANQVIPKAKGQAARILEQAQADQKKAVLVAEGDTATFDALFPKYQASPEVMRERMYLETMQQILANSRVTLVDTGKGGVFYLPVGHAYSFDFDRYDHLSANKITPSSNTDLSNNSDSGASTDSTFSTSGVMTGNINSNSNSNSGLDGSNANNSMSHYLRWQEAQNNAS